MGNYSKKMVCPMIQEILRLNTDENNTMTQTDVMEAIERVYGLKLERKAFANNIKELTEIDKRIKYVRKSRKGKILSDYDDDPNAIYTDFYYDHPFDRIELQAIIYNIIFARHLPLSTKRNIVAKLEDLMPIGYKLNMKNYLPPVDNKNNKEFYNTLMNLEILDEAISARKPVCFRTMAYLPNKTLLKSKEKFIVMPLGIVAEGGDYYLLSCLYALKGVCKMGKNRFIINYGNSEENNKDTLYFMKDLNTSSEKIESFTYVTRIDMLDDIKILNADEVDDYKSMASAFQKRGGKRAALEHFKQNNSLSSGRSITAKFRLTTTSSGIFRKAISRDCTINDVIDYFGKANVDIKVEGIYKAKLGHVLKFIVTVKTNDGALFKFAKRNIESVQIIYPEYIREKVKSVLYTAVARMKEAEEDNNNNK